ncbi:hypothetical protein K402DRAFT_347973 [Aulographum hederae CBS 113979]|uniref:Pre-mRNA polyadenylation factor Fip1 domain-containing protein n=1 Tax=Aulographum hederae CBS 113979 TaxID=1176131 RepID=A0A6G1HCS2_9PEZI|nr:hypothetical protein K402DRAFT_347973 [Aulographum hederae CBS 113979]
MDDEDDLYAQDTGSTDQTAPLPSNGAAEPLDVGEVKMDEDLEEGEEEEADDDDDDSDIEIVTEAAPGAPDTSKPFNAFKRESVPVEPVRSQSQSISQPQAHSQSAPPKHDAPAEPRTGPQLKNGASYPEVRTSSVDVNAVPKYDPAGKLITEVDIDADMAEHMKPWRAPGADQSDYFNYGFDEFTWASYVFKQQSMAGTRTEIQTETEAMQKMLGFGVAPTGNAPATPQPGATPMPGVPTGPSAQVAPQQQAPAGMDLPDQTQMYAMMSQYMQMNGISDPNKVDMQAFMAWWQQSMMGSMGGGMGMGQQGQGQQQQQQQYGGQQGYGGQGYGQQGFGGGGGGGGGGRGRRGGRW